MTDANARAAAGAPSGAPPGSGGPDVPGATDSAALPAAEWQFAGTQRAGLYGWFSRLYAQEVSEDVYRAHFAEGSFAPFAGLAELGLAAEVQRLDAAIAALRAEQLPRLELAADFAQLFLLDGKTSALPYASAYEGKEAASPLYGRAEARMRELLSARGLTLQAGFREPADHLAVPLALMADRAEKDAGREDMATAAADQADILRSTLLEWLPRFVDRCRLARPRFDFYPALSALLIGFLRADALFLGDVARHGAPIA